MERDFASLPPWQLKMLSFDYKQERVQRLKDCTFVNQQFLNQIVAPHIGLFPLDTMPNGSVVLRPQRTSASDIEKMRSTLRSFVREWSDFGALERNQCFTPLIEEALDYFKRELGREPFD